jgi:hypothetical protein
MPRRNIATLLEGGDRRSIGRSDHVAAIVLGKPELFPELITSLWSKNPVIRMRTADAVEKVTRTKPELLTPYKKELLELMAEAKDAELRWHLAAMVPQLPLNSKERQRVASTLELYLADRSSIVKTFALQGLADLVPSESAMGAAVIEILREAARNGTPAMKARSRKLLRKTERAEVIGTWQQSS